MSLVNETHDAVAVHKTGVFAHMRPKELAQASGESLNPFLALGRHVSSDLRLALSKALRTAPLKSVAVKNPIHERSGSVYLERSHICDREGRIRPILQGHCTGVPLVEQQLSARQ